MPDWDVKGRVAAAPPKASFDDEHGEFDEPQGFGEVLEMAEGLDPELVRFQ
jgi:hypothetical protein